MTKVHNLTQLAKAVGLSRQMLHRHVSAGRLTAEPGGGFDLEKAKAQLRANVKHKAGSTKQSSATPPAPQAGTAEPSTLSRAQLARELIRAQMDRLNLAKRQGEVVGIKEVQIQVGLMIVNARNR